MIKTIPQAIDDMAVSLGASPSAEIPTVAQALENVYTALGGTRTDLDTLVVSEVIDLVAPLIQGGGGGGGDFTIASATFTNTNTQGGTYTVFLPIPYPDEDNEGLVVRTISVGYDEPITMPIALFQGKMTLRMECFSNINSEVMPVITGNAELTQNGLVVTGDFTLSASSNINPG